MIYRCFDCGYVFDEPKTWQEYQGECHGVPAFETFSCCPCCGGDYEEYYADETYESEDESN